LLFLNRIAATIAAAKKHSVIGAGSGTDPCERTISGMLNDAVPPPPLLLKIVALVNGVVEIKPAKTNVLVS